MTNYINKQDKIGSILEKYPETFDFLVSNGFEQLNNPAMRSTIANSVTLEMALKMKKINEDLFCERLEEVIRQSREEMDETLKEEGSSAQGDIRVEGVLPCPIRIPLLENFTREFAKIEQETNLKIGYDLRAASMGMDWIKKQVEMGNASDLPDIMLSAGFDLFFDKKYMGKFCEDNIFHTDKKEVHSDFINSKVELVDPKQQYAILGVVPAIIMVNEKLLGNRPMPKGWEDILSPEFENTLALPMHDLDLFNAVILHIYKMYGEKGIHKLARSFQKSLHPAEMVKTKGLLTQNEEPVVSISPYFFTQMLPEHGPIKPVWPKEGAIISPIFLLAKSGKKETEKVVEYLLSKEVGDIFAASGKFPSTNPQVDNKLTKEQTFQWIGWDFIHGHDVGKILAECEETFKKIVG